MAVVQISKIQLRRGQKNSQSGIPQLSSAEMAWAVDTQELFIGNGSVQEGAPYVGNTKVLTEHDNILELAASYTFASNDNSIIGSIPRTLQNKLDEYVSVIDFGAVGDGVTDNTSAFETAFSELFNNTDSRYRKVLVVPNGVYLFKSSLRIPSRVIIRGETQLGTVLKIDSNDIRFVTTNGEELAQFTSTNRPENIDISNLTISRTSGQVVLSGITNSEFTSVNFNGQYTLGNQVSNLVAEPASLFWQNLLPGISTTEINFNDCNFNFNSISVKAVAANEPIDTIIKFNNSKFFVNHIGTLILGLEGQGNDWIFNDCKFEEIAENAFKSTYGKNTVFVDCQFKNVGNITGNSNSPVTPMVYFEEKQGNILVNCLSDRQQVFSTDVTENILAVTEVYNSDKAVFINRNFANIIRDNAFVPLTILSAENKSYTINYFLKLGNYSRTGKLTLSISDDYSNVSITDHYQYSPSLVSDQGGVTMTKFDFGAELRDNNNDTIVDTVVLSYRNPLGNGLEGSISFDVTYGV
jgi:hypothetical protein